MVGVSCHVGSNPTLPGGVSDGDMPSVMTVEFLDRFRERFAIKGLCCPPSGPASAPRNHANVEARTSEPCRTVEHCRVKAVLYRWVVAERVGTDLGA